MLPRMKEAKRGRKWYFHDEYDEYTSARKKADYMRKKGLRYLITKKGDGFGGCYYELWFNQPTRIF